MDKDCSGPIFVSLRRNKILRLFGCTLLDGLKPFWRNLVCVVREGAAKLGQAEAQLSSAFQPPLTRKGGFKTTLSAPRVRVRRHLTPGSHLVPCYHVGSRLVSDTTVTISVVVFAFLFCLGRVPIVIAFSCVHSNPLPLTPSLTIPRRPTLRTILVNYKASGHSVEAPAKCTWQSKNASWLANGVLPSVMGWAPVSEFSWSAVGCCQGWARRLLRLLEETEFPGESPILYIHL
jgi:hypothetical protein